MFKQADLAKIILIVAVSFFASYFLVGSLVKSQERSTSVPDVNQFDSNWPEVDRTVFTKNSENPTVEITIGNTESELPFQDAED